MKKLKIISIIAVCVILLLMIGISTEAKSTIEKPVGTIYSFDSDSDYDFTTVKTTNIIDEKSQTYGKFYISGDIAADFEKDYIPAYVVSDKSDINVIYKYNDTLLKAKEDERHLVDDKCKIINGIKLKSKVGFGAMLLQKSVDGYNWTDIDKVCQTNVFSIKKIQKDPIYSIKAEEISKGYYYRLIVAYETAVKNDELNFLFIHKDNFEHTRFAEVYSFYLCDKNIYSELQKQENENKYYIDEKSKTAKYSGYDGKSEIDINDVHYGWTLGKFIVSGQTDVANSNKKELVVLRNSKNKVRLKFELRQDINDLNNLHQLYISDDSGWYDKEFQTKKMSSGQGVLIVKYTGNDNNSDNPVVYRDYLKSVAMGNNTEVELNKEGKYEIALDYQITQDKFIDKQRHYRYRFNIYVSNSNAMAFPIDLSTGKELTDGSVSDGGFYIDFAKASNLTVNVERKIFIVSGQQQKTDTRFNRRASEKDKFVDPGLYIITVTNDKSNLTTKKMIYVTNNDEKMNDFITSGLTVSEYNKKVSEEIENKNINGFNIMIYLLIAGLVLFIVFIVVVVVKIKKHIRNKENEKFIN